MPPKMSTQEKFSTSNIRGSKKKRKSNYELPKVNKTNWEQTIEAIVLHLKLVRGIRGISLAYMVRQHVKVTHHPHGYVTCPNLDKEFIDRAPIVDMKSYSIRLRIGSTNRAPSVSATHSWFMMQWCIAFF